MPRWLPRRLTPLPLLCCGLAAALAVRLAELAPAHASSAALVMNTAFAPTLAASLPAAPAGTAPADAAPRVPADAAPRPAPLGEDQVADGKLLTVIARRQAALDRREHDLDTRALQVEAASRLAQQEIAELTRMRAGLERLVVHETGVANADLDLLVGLYSNMKPAQAAAVLGKLDPPQAAVILQKLDVRAAGPILAAMEPTVALAITQEVVQRRAAFRP